MAVGASARALHTAATSPTRPQINVSSPPHTGPVPWAKYGHGDSHMARLHNGWQLFIIKAEGLWRWNVNAPGGGGHLSDAEVEERIRRKQAEQRGGTLQRGETARDAKKAAEVSARRCGVIT